MKNHKIRLIVREGYRHMQLHGYTGTSVEDVLESLSIPKGSFYYYFRTKEHFALEVLDYYCHSMIISLRKVLLNTEVSPKNRIVKMYSDYIDNFINKGHFSYGNFAGKLSQEVGEKMPSIREAAVAFFDQVKGIHIECLNDARRQGEISRSRDVERIAEAVILTWEGAVMRMKATGNCKPLFVFREILKNSILG